MWKIILLCIIVGIVAKSNKRYDEYKLFAIKPTSEKQLNTLHDMKKVREFCFSETPSLNETVNILVRPDKLEDFYKLTFKMNIHYEILDYNVQEWIDEHSCNLTELLRRYKRYHFNRFPTLNETYLILDDIAYMYPDNVEIIVAGLSYEGNEIRGAKVSFLPNKPGIFIEGGIRGNQWISPATVLYILYELLNNDDANVKELAWNHDWYIFPMFNPDGYKYTYTKDRFWQKTRSLYAIDNGTCFGALLDVNWCDQWINDDNITDPCSPEFAGNYSFSEVEAKLMSEYIRTISDQFYAYISFRGYGGYLLFPCDFPDELKNRSFTIAEKAIEALKISHGTKYSIGCVPELFYMSTGCTAHYIQETYGKRIIFEYNLPKRDQFEHLMPINDEIVLTGEETLDSLVALFKEADKDMQKKN